MAGMIPSAVIPGHLGKDCRYENPKKLNDQNIERSEEGSEVSSHKGNAPQRKAISDTRRELDMTGGKKRSKLGTFSTLLTMEERSHGFIPASSSGSSRQEAMARQTELDPDQDKALLEAETRRLPAVPEFRARTGGAAAAPGNVVQGDLTAPACPLTPPGGHRAPESSARSGMGEQEDKEMQEAMSPTTIGDTPLPNFIPDRYHIGTQPLVSSSTVDTAGGSDIDANPVGS